MGIYKSEYTTEQIEIMLDAAYEGVINLPWAEWSSAITYKPLNKAVYQGSSYVSLTTNTNSTPTTNPSDWLLIAQKGEKGDQGDMAKSVYDPNNKDADVFDMGNMTETETKKIMTDTERIKLSELGFVVSTTQPASGFWMEVI